MYGGLRFASAVFVIILLSLQMPLAFSQYDGNVIRIDGNLEFWEWAKKMNCSGDGSAEDPYIIENITMNVPFKTDGIFISNTTVHFIIRNCNISFAHGNSEKIFFSGIKLYNVANAVIESNTFYKDEMAISIYESSNVKVMHNEFYGDDVGGIYLKRSENVNISDNHFERGGGFVFGLYATNITLSNNTICCYKESGIFFELSSHLRIIKNEMRVERGLKYPARSREAIWMHSSKFILIENNSIDGGKFQWDGISIYHPSGVIIRDNEIIRNNACGIRMVDGKNITLYKNDISFNFMRGISLLHPNGAVVENNRIIHNLEGVEVYDSQNTLIVKNLIAFNVIGTYVSRSKTMEIYNNSFFYNRGSGDKYNSSHVQAWDENGAARWYDPSGYGNYWNDWARNNDTNDKNGDGIVDFPYKIGKGIDYYPLKYPPKEYKVEPTPPRKLRLTYGNGYLNISWKPPIGNGTSPIIGYIVYRNKERIATLPLTTLYYNDTSLKNGEKYEYYVTAFNSEKESLRSNVVKGIPGIPEKPVNLTAHSERKYVYISWEPPLNKGASEIEYYRVYRAPYISPPLCPSGPPNWELIAVVPAAHLYYVDANVSIGTSYLYSVSAVNKYGEGPKSSGVVGRAGTVPSPPLNLTVVNEGDHFNITWNASKDNGGWEIFEYRVYCNGELIAKIYAYDHRIFYYNYTPEYPGVYACYVTAVNAIGESAPSDMVTISYKVPNKNWGVGSSGEGYIWIDLEILGISLTVIFLCVIVYKRIEGSGRK